MSVSTRPSLPGTPPTRRRLGPLLREPRTWVALWALYTLAALGYFAWLDAWYGLLTCGAPD